MRPIQVMLRLSIYVTLQRRMKIKFLIPVVGKGFVYGDGKVYDLPTAEAEYWIKEGNAQAVKGEPVQRPLIVQQIKTTKRPVKK